MTHTPTAATCPPHVSEYLAETIPGDRSHGFEIDSIVEAKSAQQQVLILTLSSSLLNNNNIPEPFRTALENGRGKLVLRIWRKCAKWWNLNRNENDDMTKMARAEVAAYRIARRALSFSSSVYIPTVLYFSHDENSDDNKIHEQSQHKCRENGAKACTGDHCTCNPWALLEYVGPESTLFSETCEYTTKWVDEMITTRHEFGFDEPHPRWGRVPIDSCLQYAMQVVDTIILPMHLYFFETEESIQWSADLGIPVNNTVRGRRFRDMLDLYRSTHQTIREQILGSSDEYSQTSVAVWKKCLDALKTEADTAGLLHDDRDDIPAVLVHMDCQPQNVICCQQEGEIRIVSILDWEEAAYADPRFELLLLCRKVCANRQQATQLWDYYNSKILYNIGPLEPWLQLETVHSITTLLLQCCNCGGRSPWETRNDLKGKLQREFARLHAMGWDFCEEIIK